MPLAMIGAAASQTLGRTAGASPKKAFHDRLSAFAAAHDALSAAAKPTAKIEDFITQALKPHGELNDRFLVFGPEVMIGSCQALALAIHELATNAVKYGALSVPEGRVELSWRADPECEFVLRWRERGGPAVARPARKGFGSRLIERVLTAEFGGALVMDYDPNGVVATLTSPGVGQR